MKPSDETMRRYLQELQRVELREQSLRRLAVASGRVADALQEAASGSLFDTEPATLNQVLDQLAADDAPGVGEQ